MPTVGTGDSRAPTAVRGGGQALCTCHSLPSPAQTCELLLHLQMGPYRWWVGGRTAGRSCEEGPGETLTRFPLVAAEPLPLMDLCRRSIRLALGRQRLQDIGSLPLPQSLKNYLQYQ